MRDYHQQVSRQKSGKADEGQKIQHPDRAIVFPSGTRNESWADLYSTSASYSRKRAWQNSYFPAALRQTTWQSGPQRKFGVLCLAVPAWYRLFELELDAGHRGEMELSC